MPLSRDEAADALKDFDAAERRSASAYGYRMASPHLILWGLIWALGYGAMYLSHGRDWAMVWPALSLAGVIASFAIGLRMKSSWRGASFGWRYASSFVALVAFIVALFAVLPPTRDAQVAAFFPLLVALAYVLLGIWGRALRIAAIGAVIGALTLYGYFALDELYLLWLAAVGGGALVLGGLWMRSA